MSQANNTLLLDRAAELLELVQSHPSGYDEALSRAVLSGDLDEVRYWVNRIEGELAREHFYGMGVVNEVF